MNGQMKTAFCRQYTRCSCGSTIKLFAVCVNTIHFGTKIVWWRWAECRSLLSVTKLTCVLIICVVDIHRCFSLNTLQDHCSQARSQVLTCGGGNIFSGEQDFCCYYIFIKTFLGTTEFGGTRQWLSSSIMVRTDSESITDWGRVGTEHGSREYLGGCLW